MAATKDLLKVPWKELRDDPVRVEFVSRGIKPDLDSVLSLFPRITGDPAFDPVVIAGNIARLETEPRIDTGHPLLDQSVKTGLASIDATFQGDHPKYGVKKYGKNSCDAFPPVIIAVVDALTAWGINKRAAHLFKYWVEHFIRADGSIAFPGASICECGQLLHTAALLEERAGAEDWWDACRPGLGRLTGYLMTIYKEASKSDGLLPGVPEDDEKNNPGIYFHNNAWAAKGFSRWVCLCERLNALSSDQTDELRFASDSIMKNTLLAIDRVWPDEDASDWWLAPMIEPVERPACATGTRTASYTNYRYWPELLSSGILSGKQAARVLESRFSAGGQFCGMSRMAEFIDDWPLADYLYGLWALGREDDFLLSLYGHVAYHQAEGHLTAYEAVTSPPFREYSPYCLPCQLVPARAAGLLRT